MSINQIDIFPRADLFLPTNVRENSKIIRMICIKITFTVIRWALLWLAEDEPVRFVVLVATLHKISQLSFKNFQLDYSVKFFQIISQMLCVFLNVATC